MIASAMLALALAAKPVPAPLKPLGPWIVRAEESMCLLERNYTAGATKLSLIFQPLLDMDEMEVYVVGESRPGQQYVGKFSASVASATPYTGRYFSVSEPKSKARVTRLTTDRQMLSTLKDGDALRITAKPVDQIFTIVRPEKARVALQKCTDDLKKAWGVTTDAAGERVTPADGNPARYFSPESYPNKAYTQGIYGRVIALLNVDAAGAVSNCRILSSAGPSLNEGTCTAAKRIRFKPARDKDGQPLASTYVLPVRWVLPGSPG